MSDDEESSARGTVAANKAARFLVAASCILATRGELDVFPPLADDGGTNLLFHRRGGRSALAVQVKARRSTAKSVRHERFRQFVRSQTFQPRTDFDILFVALDVERVAITMAWLVPSPAFAALAAGPDAKGRLRFAASIKPDADDQWLPFRLAPEQLPPLVLRRLHQLDDALARIAPYSNRSQLSRLLIRRSGSVGHAVSCRAETSEDPDARVRGDDG